MTSMRGEGDTTKGFTYNYRFAQRLNFEMFPFLSISRRAYYRKYAYLIDCAAIQGFFCAPMMQSYLN